MNKKTSTHLSVEERETLSLGLAQGQTLRAMASILGRPPSTLSREQRWNGIKPGPYRACTAQHRALARRR